MNIDTIIAFSEVNKIISLLEDKYAKRIPKKLMDVLAEVSDVELEPEIDVEKTLLEQNISREAIVILSTIYLSYLCDSDEEKQELLNVFRKNDEEKRLLEEKYNSNNLFKGKKYDEDQNLKLIKYDEKNFIEKICDTIKKIFKRK